MQPAKFRFIKQYFGILLFFVVLHGPIMVVGSASGIRSVFILTLLLSYSILDVILITINLKIIRLNKIEITLIILLLITIVAGIVNTPQITRRHITDLLMPVTFVFKIAITRHFLRDKEHHDYFTTVFIPRFVKGTFISGIISVVLFYIVTQFKPMYIGLTPIIYPMLITAMLSKRYSLMLISIFVILLSGKRSVLLGTSIIILVYYIYIRRNKIISLLSIISLVAVGYIVFLFSGVQESRAFRKYMWTIEKIPEIVENPEILDIVTGGRLGEINGILGMMNTYDYIFGKGVGFVYVLDTAGYRYIKEHANAHFTPLSIASKYGVFFYLVLMTYVLSSLFKARRKAAKKDYLSIVFFLFIIGINIDFLFAYGFFTNKLFPFAIGYLNRKKESVPLIQ